jgi:UDP-3-O-[3-hydroxymyristoyl] glucosamine N-acyltransferase
MAKIDFFPPALNPTYGELAAMSGSTLADGAPADKRVVGIAPLDLARECDLAFFENRRYLPMLRETRAGLILIAPAQARAAPTGAALLLSPHPMHALAAIMAKLYPNALRPGAPTGEAGVSKLTSIHPSARLEPGVVVEAFAVIGPRAEIGAGTIIGPHAVIGPDVRIGRNGSIGAGVSVLAALIGDRVIIHPGVRIGQDGFGFAMGPKGHKKAPQIGRVIIQDDVEIGANTAIDRGANRDTMVGEGTKIDNLVQIGHNVVVGRHCVIVAQVGIAGSTVLEDFVAMGGQSAVAGHLRVGLGAQVAAQGGVMHDIPPGQTWMGSPATPAREALRMHATLKRLSSRHEAAD